MKNEKEFDAVRMMREARAKLNQQYRENPSAYWKRLQGIAEKMGFPKKEEKQALA